MHPRYHKTIHTIQFHNIAFHDWSYDLVTTVRAKNCLREQLFANGSGYLDTARFVMSRDRDTEINGNKPKRNLIKLHTDPKEKAELLQAQYVKVFSDPNEAHIEESLAGLNPVPVKELDHMQFSANDISEAIKELDPYSSTPDGDIPARILTKCRETLSEPIFLLWQDSFETGVIPPSMKTQFIAPVYKKGDRTEAANYRPVSITSHIIKIFERVIRNNLVEHMEANNFLSPHQHGFRKKRSCLTQLLDHVDTILKSLNSGEEVDAYTSITPKRSIRWITT